MKPNEMVLKSLGRYGADNGSWTSTPSYSTVHKWLAKNYIKSKKCAECGSIGRTEFALLKGKEHARDIAHYRELCVTCHKLYDRKELCKYGHNLPRKGKCPICAIKYEREVRYKMKPRKLKRNRISPYNYIFLRGCGWSFQKIGDSVGVPRQQIRCTMVTYQKAADKDRNRLIMYWERLGKLYENE